MKYFELRLHLEYSYGVSLLSLQILVDSEDKQKCEEDPSSSEEMPDIVTIVEIE